MRSILKYHQKLLTSSCALMSVLFLSAPCTPMEQAESILSPCVYPSASSTHETGERLTPDFFDNNANKINENERKESILMWLERGGDRRHLVLNTKEFPYSAQVYFTVTFPRSQKRTCEIGSGTFIDQDVILTAAHVVYSHEKGGYYTTIQCTPAPDKSIAPFGVASVKNVKVSSKYVEKGGGYKQHDYALVFIDRLLGEKTGYLGIAAPNNKEIQNAGGGSVYIMSETAEEEIAADCTPALKKQQDNRYILFVRKKDGSVAQVDPEDRGFDMQKLKEVFDSSTGKIHLDGGNILFQEIISKGGHTHTWVNVWGYPGDKIIDIYSPQMWGMTGNLVSICPGEFHHDIDTYAGQSGSGIWYKTGRDTKPEYYLIGIHAYGNEANGLYNYGPRLTREKGEEILGWVNAYKENTLKFESRIIRAKRIQEAGLLSITRGGAMSIAQESVGEQRLPTELLEKAKSQSGLDWYDIGLHYEEGNPDDPAYPDKSFEWFEKAFDWFQKPENQENSEVQHKLALMYKNGRYVNRKDNYKAVEWWQKAAAQGHARAQSNLAVMYEHGDGVEQSYGEAFKWYERAALQENVYAQYKLGDMYEKGTGTSKDHAKAVEWYEKSASNGSEDAREALERHSPGEHGGSISFK